MATESKAAAAIQYTQHAEKLSLLPHGSDDTAATSAVKARFVTPQDPVIETANGSRLPAVPLEEAIELNKLKTELERDGSGVEKCQSRPKSPEPFTSLQTEHDAATHGPDSPQSTKAEAPLRTAIPPSKTNPLFPELPLYGPPSLMRNLQCYGFRFTSFFLSLSFLGVIVLGSAFTSIPLMFKHIALRLRLQNPDARRPFFEEEKRRKQTRKAEAKAWKRQRRLRNNASKAGDSNEEAAGQREDYVPTEGGKDPLLCDVAYYARRVGLDVEEYKVQTEDGFMIALWHVYNPLEYKPASAEHRGFGKPAVFPARQVEQGITNGTSGSQYVDGRRRYPVLLVHGLLQSAGAYCTNDDDSLAFFLCKSGYDVWLGNNRCGFKPEHQMLTYDDPRMWNWNIRQMGVMDLPALISRVLSETGFEKLGLVCHSQGTTQTFVALAKEQRPDIGDKISVFCALAPAVYAGPLIGKMYLKFMRIISPNMFRMFFGIHAFIPFMMTMHSFLPGTLYGAMGYRVFSFLFNWSDARWDRDLRDRMFQFAPVYVSAEAMRWWLGRECFASQKCILATRDKSREEDKEDQMEDYYEHGAAHSTEDTLAEAGIRDLQSRGRHAWYDKHVPPFALWVAGSDDLVDGRRLLRRFERGREPYVRVVHSKIIEEYEHLDVLWAMDSIEKVGKEVRKVVWKTAPASARKVCRIPWDCEGVQPWQA